MGKEQISREFETQKIMEAIAILAQCIQDGYFTDNNGQKVHLNKQQLDQLNNRLMELSAQVNIPSLQVSQDSTTNTSNPQPSETLPNNDLSLTQQYFNNNQILNPLTGEIYNTKDLTPQQQYELLLLNRDFYRAVSLTKSDVQNKLSRGSIGASGSLRRIPYGWRPKAEEIVRNEILSNYGDINLSNPNQSPQALSALLALKAAQNSSFGVEINNGIGSRGNTLYKFLPGSNFYVDSDYTWNTSLQDPVTASKIRKHLSVLDTMLNSDRRIANGDYSHTIDADLQALYGGDAEALKIRQHLINSLKDQQFVNKNNEIYNVGLSDFAKRLQESRANGTYTPSNAAAEFLREYAEETGTDALNMYDQSARLLLHGNSAFDDTVSQVQRNAASEVEKLNNFISQFEKENNGKEGFTLEEAGPIGLGDRLWNNEGVSKSDARMYALSGLTGTQDGMGVQSAGQKAAIDFYTDKLQETINKSYNTEYKQIVDQIKQDPSIADTILSQLNVDPNQVLDKQHTAAHMIALINARQSANKIFDNKDLIQDGTIAAENASSLYNLIHTPEDGKVIDFTKPLADQVELVSVEDMDPLRRGNLTDMSVLHLLNPSWVTGNPDHVKYNAYDLLVGAGNTIDTPFKKGREAISNAIHNAAMPDNPSMQQYVQNQVGRLGFNQGGNALGLGSIVGSIAKINPAIDASEGIDKIIESNRYNDTRNPNAAGASIFDEDNKLNLDNTLEQLYNIGTFGTSTPRTSGGAQIGKALLDTLLLGTGSGGSAAYKTMPNAASMSMLEKLPYQIGFKTAPGFTRGSQFLHNLNNSILGQTLGRPVIGAAKSAVGAWKNNPGINPLLRAGYSGIKGVGTAVVDPLKQVVTNPGVGKAIGTVLDPYFGMNLNPYWKQVFSRMAQQSAETITKAVAPEGPAVTDYVDGAINYLTNDKSAQ